MVLINGRNFFYIVTKECTNQRSFFFPPRKEWGEIPKPNFFFLTSKCINRDEGNTF